MKKLLFILPAIFFTLAANAQQTEDDIYVGKTFGNYKGTGIIIPDVNRDKDPRKAKPVAGQTTITGMVVGACKRDCCNKKRTFCSVDVKKDDGTIVTVGTRDYGFTSPGLIVGRRIMVEGLQPGKLPREKGTVKKDYQKNIQFAATGIMVI